MGLSPFSTARLTGFCWLLTIVSGFAALLVKGSGGLAANVVASLSYMGASLFAASLLRPVNRMTALLTGVLGIAGSLLGIERTFIHVLSLPPNSAFFLFGTQCFLLGILIFRSTYLPRWVGVVLGTGGLGWLIFGMTSILSPESARGLMPIMFPGIIGETCLTAWLLLKGIDPAKWKSKVGSSV